MKLNTALKLIQISISIDKFERSADAEAVIAICNTGKYYIENITMKTLAKKTHIKPLSLLELMSILEKELDLSLSEAIYYLQKLHNGIKIAGEHKSLVGHSNGITRIMYDSITPEQVEKYVKNETLVGIYKLIWQYYFNTAKQSPKIMYVYTINNNGHRFEFIHEQLIANVGECLTRVNLILNKEFTKSKARYSEASMLAELYKLNVADVNTCLAIVKATADSSRGCVELTKNGIIPTSRGLHLINYCDRSFPKLFSLSASKSLASNLANVANGKLTSYVVLKDFYNQLKIAINTTAETGVASELPAKICPECGKTMIVRRSRFGKLFYGCDYPSCRYTESIK